jgi:hypothetical protein
MHSRFAEYLCDAAISHGRYFEAIQIADRKIDKLQHEKNDDEQIRLGEWFSVKSVAESCLQNYEDSEKYSGIAISIGKTLEANGNRREIAAYRLMFTAMREYLRGQLRRLIIIGETPNPNAIKKLEDFRKVTQPANMYFTEPLDFDTLARCSIYMDLDLEAARKYIVESLRSFRRKSKPHTIGLLANDWVYDRICVTRMIYRIRMGKLNSARRIYNRRIQARPIEERGHSKAIFLAIKKLLDAEEIQQY